MFYTPNNNTNFDDAIKYYFDNTNPLPGGTNNTHSAVMNISSWDVSGVSRMRDAFLNRNDFNENIGNWNVSDVNDMRRMFKEATTFNQKLDWSMNQVNYAEEMFFNASSFNNGETGNTMSNPLDWSMNVLQDSTGIALGLQGMFHGASAFNQRLGLGNWVITSVRSLNNMFNGCTSITDDALSGINNWDTSNVTDMQYIFKDCNDASFVKPGISYWNTNSLNDMNSMFYGASNFNENISTKYDISNDLIAWDVSGANDKQLVFLNASAFNNGDLSGQSNSPLNWNIGQANNLQQMFSGATSFNQPIDFSNVIIDMSGGNTYQYKQWDVSGVEKMGQLFLRCTSFNQSISNWNTSKVEKMGQMFKNAKSFNQPLIWQTDSVDNMRSMFEGASLFNQNLSYRLVNNKHVWNMENVVDIQDMFKNASNFNNGNSAFQWNILSISGNAMTGLFRGASSFNQDINTTSLVNPSIPLWDVSQVTHFSEIFDSATSFNNGRTSEVEPFNWNTEKAVEMSWMFHGASSFNQDVQDWFKQGKLLDMSNAQVSGSFTYGLREMFEGATSFAAFAREWVIPNNITITDIFDGATDMSNIFYPGRSDTSYNSTPGSNFFNYDAQNDPGLKYNISYPNYYEDSTFAIILPVTSDISGDTYIEIPYNLVFGNIDISSSTPTPNADTISVSSNVDISGAKNLNYTQDSNNENRTFLVDLPLKHNGNTLVTLPLEITVQYGLLPVPPVPPIPPPQKSGREYACSNKKRFGCPAYMANSDKNGGLFSGNTNQPNFMAVEAYKYSNLVNFSSRRQSMKTQYIPLQLNVFGKYEGAPGGSGMRLKNKF